jgi:phage FluMu protein Com
MKFELRCHFCKRLLGTTTGVPKHIEIICEKCGKKNFFRRRHFPVDAAESVDKVSETTSSPREGHNAFHARTEGLK